VQIQVAAKLIQAVISLAGRTFDITEERCAQCNTPLINDDGTFSVPLWDENFEKLFCEGICQIRYRAFHLN
jgi:hypothetical protein